MTCKRSFSILSVCLGLSLWGSPIQAQLFNLAVNDVPLESTGSRSAGSSQSWGRAACVSGEQPLNSLIPQQVIARTAETYPTLFFHVPQTSAQYAILVVEDKTGENYSEETYPITQEGGIIGLDWPKYFPLKEEEVYTWRVVFACGRFAAPDDPNFRGQLQRISFDPSTIQNLAHQPLPQQAVWYETQGYWHDLLSLLAIHPEDADSAKIWSTLLESHQIPPIPLLPLQSVP
jgi:hypothetical protein